MGIIYQKDKRSGITYAYESVSWWDKEKKQSRSQRRLIGRLDEATGSVIPTDGRCRKDAERPNKPDKPKPGKRTEQPIPGEDYRLLYEKSLLEKRQLQSELESCKIRISELETALSHVDT